MKHKGSRRFRPQTTRSLRTVIIWCSVNVNAWMRQNLLCAGLDGLPIKANVMEFNTTSNVNIEALKDAARANGNGHKRETFSRNDLETGFAKKIEAFKNLIHSHGLDD